MKAQIVSFRCVLKNKLGQSLGSSFNHDVINQLDPHANPASNQPLRGLIAGLQNVSAGERRELTVPADDAYGTYDPALLITVPRSELANRRVQIGSEVLGYSKAGDGTRPFRVVNIQNDQITLDANHPLAGQDLVFEIEVTAAREAEEDDLGETLTSPQKSHLH